LRRLDFAQKPRAVVSVPSANVAQLPEAMPEGPLRESDQFIRAQLDGANLAPRREAPRKRFDFCALFL
jgi:hypothetical protein